MEFWKMLSGLQGKVLKTLAQNKQFTVVHISQNNVVIIPHQSNKPRPIYMKEIEGSYRKMIVIGQITRIEIEAQFSPRNPAYVAAILATLPGVKVHRKPIITLEI